MNIDVNKPVQLAVISVVLAGALYTSISDIEQVGEVETVDIPDEPVNESATDNQRQETVSNSSSDRMENQENQSSDEEETESRSEILEEKKSQYRQARPLDSPEGYINTDNVSIEENIGDKVILLDMWTYSCINCQRTLPHLREWHRKYKDDGLLIIGNHAPEFEFEEKRANVEAAVNRFNITYPVVMDNDMGTWRNYNNRYWPQKYLIGIDGFIRYEHIGEGSYNETEQKIKELLQERKERLGVENPVDEDGVKEMEKDSRDSSDVNFSKIQTPEIYFGAWRNEYFANGEKETEGRQTLTAPSRLEKDKFYLSGTWRIENKYAEGSSGDEILINYSAKNVNMVLDGKNTKVSVYHDGEPVEELAGESVDEDSTVAVDGERLYKIIDKEEYGRNKLRLKIEEGSLQAYTFTFG